MGAPKLEVVNDTGGGGYSPPSSKNTMFKIGKFKVTKPMFYIGGLVVVLLLIIFVKSRSNAPIASGPMFYPDGTEGVDNGVDVQAQLQNYETMMGNKFNSVMNQLDSNLTMALKEMQQENNLLQSELRNEQKTVIAELQRNNSSLMGSVQQMLASQLANLQQSYQSVNAGYQHEYNSGYNQSSPSYDNSYSQGGWQYNNPAPTGDYSTTNDPAGYRDQMNRYLNEVNGTRQDLIQQGVSTGDWQPSRYFESTKTPENYYYNSNTGNLDYSAQYYKDSEFSSRMAAQAARERGDMATAAIWEKEQQKAIDAMNKAQNSNLKKG